MNQHIVVLNKIKDAVNLFEKRSGVYSSRPTVPVIEMYGYLESQKICDAHLYLDRV